MAPSLDFGYPLWLSHGHAALFVAGLVVTLAGRALHWRRWLLGVLVVVTMWAGTAAAAVEVGLGVNRVPALPTDAFLRHGVGHVLDLGAGTGRSTIMVLAARPQATVTALDLFGDSFDLHFGREGSPEERLRRNLRAAGVGDRASVASGDMRALPFGAATFDAAVSAYAMDHLGRDGARTALVEAHRVLRPGGQFLLILVNDDWLTRLAFGPALAHGGLPDAAWWRRAAADAGFNVSANGRRPATMWFLLEGRSETARVAGTADAAPAAWSKRRLYDVD